MAIPMWIEFSQPSAFQKCVIDNLLNVAWQYIRDYTVKRLQKFKISCFELNRGCHVNALTGAQNFGSRISWDKILNFLGKETLKTSYQWPAWILVWTSPPPSPHIYKCCIRPGRVLFTKRKKKFNDRSTSDQVIGVTIFSSAREHSSRREQLLTIFLFQENQKKHRVFFIG